LSDFNPPTPILKSINAINVSFSVAVSPGAKRGTQKVHKGTSALSQNGG